METETQKDKINVWDSRSYCYCSLLPESLQQEGRVNHGTTQGQHSLLAKVFLTLCDPTDCSTPGSSVEFSRQEYWSG